MSDTTHEFTRDVVNWVPHLSLVEPTVEQLAALGLPPRAKPSSFQRVLMHDFEILTARLPLFNEIMVGKEGVKPVLREFAATVTSVVNGCTTCASIHARGAVSFGCPEAVIDAVLAGSDCEEFDEPYASVGVFARELTNFTADTSSVERLRRQGFEPVEILELIHAVALFNWATRLMHPLGSRQ